MISERWMAKGIDIKYRDITHIGYLVKMDRKAYILTEIDDNGNIFGCMEDMAEVDPATIEPVKVRPVCEMRGTHPPREVYLCPNCGGKVGKWHQHHIKCGMALDWSEAT